MKTKRIFAILLAAVMMLALAACGNSSAAPAAEAKSEAAAPAAEAKSEAAAPAAEASSAAAPAEEAAGETYTIGVTTWGSGVPILDMFGNENEYVLGLLGMKTNRVSDDFTADKQVTNVQTLISAGVNGIVNQGSGVTTIPQMAELCKQAGIPIVFNVSCGLEEDLEALQKNNEFYVGAIDLDMYLDGQMMGQKAYEDGCRTATMIGGNVGDQDIDKRMNGFTDKFEELGGKVLANARCTDNSECPTKAEDMLSANSEADCIYATVGDYVAGSMSAIENLGLDTKIYCSCTDEDSAKYILEGKIAAGNDGIGLACAIAPALLINYLDGHQILNDEGLAPRLQTQPITVTAENAQEYIDFFYGSHAFTEEMFTNLVWRCNPDVTYADFEDLMKNLNFDYIREMHNK
ncbi:MAG: substrate-binding domain-containing protein [Lachnospiraceae bacterium]|nr:substrate-binding domain-containing protein [Lachnospiraceae bacterium]